MKKVLNYTKIAVAKTYFSANAGSVGKKYLACAYHFQKLNITNNNSNQNETKMKRALCLLEASNSFFGIQFISDQNLG